MQALATHPLDLADIKGQESAKRALEVAAAGGHNLLMVGPPGSGKSMLAQRLPGLLPPLDPAAALEVSMIHSVAGQLAGGRLMRNRPFRDPHHSASLPSLIGGGQRAKPGEVSLAHHGVLFLDELPEFARATLESLRQPLESGRAVVARVHAHVTYPARFQLVAAMNPCRCGHLDDASLACGRAPKCAQEYQAKISGPLFDRIDMHVDVPAVSPADLALPPPREGSRQVAARVAAAREIQAARYAGKEIRSNAEADGQLLDEVATPDAEGRKLLAAAAERFQALGAGLSPRAAGGADLGGYRGQRRRPPGACGRGAQLPADRAGEVLRAIPCAGYRSKLRLIPIIPDSRQQAEVARRPLADALADLPSVAAAVGIGVAFDRVERPIASDRRHGDAHMHVARLAVDAAADKEE